MTKQNESTEIATTSLKFSTELSKVAVVLVFRGGTVGLNSRQLKKQNVHHPQRQM